MHFYKNLFYHSRRIYNILNIKIANKQNKLSINILQNFKQIEEKVTNKELY